MLADPKVHAALITFTAALLASGTALYIARFVYPIQKRKDRELELHGEKRDVYRSFFRTATTYHSTCLRNSEEGAEDRAQEQYHGLVGPVMDVLLYGEDEQAKAAKAYISAIGKYRDHVFLDKDKREPDWSKKRQAYFKESIKRRNESLVSFRSDLLDQDVETARSVVGGYFAKFLEEDE